MNIGKLRRQITIEQPSSTTDAWGQPVVYWYLFGRYFADIKNTTGIGMVRGERIAGDKEMSSSAYSIRIRYNPSVNATMRVVYNSQNFLIRQAIHDQARHQYTDLVCELQST